jgi:DNA-binding MarR family transcriptional regulator
MRVKQFGTLCYIRDHGPCCSGTWASLYMDPNNLVLLLKAPRGPGWIERRRDPDRRHIVPVTTDGERAIDRASARWRRDGCWPA